MPELTTAPAVPEITAAQEAIRTQAAAVCSLGAPGGCKWYSSGGTEVEIIAEAAEHVAGNPGHRVTCQVKQTRTWTVADAIDGGVKP